MEFAIYSRSACWLICQRHVPLTLNAKLVLWAQSTTQAYIRAENKLQSNPGHSICKSSLFVKIFHKETSTTQHTSYFVEHTNLSRDWLGSKHQLTNKLSLGKSKSLYSLFQNTNQETQEHMFWGLFIFRGNLHQSSWTRSRVTSFILWAHAETSFIHN